jgi:4-amino-4-deoxy-L-arabinose transferase-like glycosyltransferase
MTRFSQLIARYRWTVLLLLVAGFTARVRYYAACPSYWYDEAYLLLNVFHRSYPQLLGPLQDDQAAPPLFLWCLRCLFRTIGGDEWAMRLPALAAGLLGLVVLIPLARNTIGRRGYWCAVACGAMCPHAIAHACEVKPYTLDVLVAEVVLLASLAVGAKPRAKGRRSVRWWLLGAVVVLAPWFSFPSVFVAGSACLALAATAVRRGRCDLYLTWIVVQGAFLLSCLALWLVVGRHQSTSGLYHFWESSFIDLSSPLMAVSWLARCMVEAGNYASRDMGLLMIVLGVLGSASLWRRAPHHLILLAGPLALALAGCVFRIYPLRGRLLLFLAPSLWLLAGHGLVFLARFRPHRLAWMRHGLSMALLLPACVWVGRNLAEVTPRAQFREAFDHVRASRINGDALWVSHAQVYEVYHSQPPELSACSSSEQVTLASRRGRLWLIRCVGSRGRSVPNLDYRVNFGASVVLERRCFKGVEVLLFAPARPTPNHAPGSSSEQALLPILPTAPACPPSKRHQTHE